MPNYDYVEKDYAYITRIKDEVDKANYETILQLVPHTILSNVPISEVDYPHLEVSRRIFETFVQEKGLTAAQVKKITEDYLLNNPS